VAADHTEDSGRKFFYGIKGVFYIPFMPYLMYIKYTMFEFDTSKSAINQQKHGISFVTAQALWKDPDLLEIPARTQDEPRSLVIGKLSGKHWSAVITYRAKKIRIISVRRSRKEEVNLYESKRL